MNNSRRLQLMEILTNVIDLNGTEKYAMILGENPSITARSPRLWNSVYSQLEMNSVMHPFDVAAEMLSELWEFIVQDQRCIGGSVAMPYKQEVFKLLNGNTDQVTDQIGAVNCLYRRQDGQLFGTNTDGPGALTSIEEEKIDVQSSNILVFGIGGVGKSVAASISNALGSKNSLMCCGRNLTTSQFCDTIGAKFVPLEELNARLNSIDLFINTSSLGFGEDQDKSPLSIAQLKLLKTGCLVFDVIYNPKKTKLLLGAEQLGHRIKNGESMNLDQAIKAFTIVNELKISRVDIRKMMTNAVN
jgi:shikimate dehydrogenase